MFQFIHAHKGTWPVRLMCRGLGVSVGGYYDFRRTTDANHDRPVAENVLDRAFTPAKPNASWVADLTDLPTAEGWVYLAAVCDLYSRAVVGWSMGSRIDSRPVVDALEMAVARRCPGEGLVSHSDRGTQSASAHDRRVLAENGIVCSMSRRGGRMTLISVSVFRGEVQVEPG